MKRFIVLGMLMIAFGVNTGCAVSKAANQPDKKDVNLFSKGTSRAKIIAEFGTPMNSEMRNGKREDIYKFTQGYSTGAKTGRALFHGAADIATLGLWELIATPTEGAFDGDNMAFKVVFDENDRVEQVSPLNEDSQDEHSAESNFSKIQPEDCDSESESCY
jgi:outer membrane protein assembly factor BamE (lipoprotein component of BamABCDE complex)